VYGITGDRANYPVANDNDAYFVYFNNLFLTVEDGEEPQQTYAYKIWEDSSNDYFMCRDIQKHPDNSWYLIYATNFTNLSDPVVLELQINVGEPNQLKTWRVGDYFGYAFYGWYNGDTPHFRIIAEDYQNYVFYLAEDNGDNVSYTGLSCDTTIERGQRFYIKNDYVATNENNIYFVYNVNIQNENDNDKRSCLYKYDGTDTIKTIYKTQLYNTSTGIYPMLNVVRDINTIYALEITTDTNNLITTIKVANISDHAIGDYNFEQICSFEYYVFPNNLYNFRTALRRNFNIVYFNSFCGYFREGLGSYSQAVNGFTNSWGGIVQQIGYTGYQYSSYNVLNPRYANLYYLHIALMFSRNVYNVTRFENTSTASVEIPAKYLNNYAINGIKLFGFTGYNLIDDQQTTIIKNKYEIVHINFINTINVLDEDTSTYYKQGAIKVNYGSTIGTEGWYNNSKCTKYRINYNDGTTLSGTINWSAIDDTHKNTSFLIYVDKAIDSIDLLSNANDSIYMRIIDTFTIGKYYNIRQKVRVE
jgi:hypothetical protein